MSKPRGWGLSEGALNNLSNYSQTVLSFGSELNAWILFTFHTKAELQSATQADLIHVRINDLHARRHVSHSEGAQLPMCVVNGAEMHLVISFPPHTSTQIGLNSWEYAAFPLLGGSWRTKMLSDSSIRHQVSRGASKRERGGFLITCF